MQLPRQPTSTDSVLFCRLTGVGRGTSRMAWYRGGTVKSVAGDIQYKVTFRAINKLHSIIRRHWFKWLYLLEYCADINKFGVGYNTWQLDEVTRWLHAFVCELLSHCISNLRSPWHSQCLYWGADTALTDQIKSCCCHTVFRTAVRERILT